MRVMNSPFPVFIVLLGISSIERNELWESFAVYFKSSEETEFFIRNKLKSSRNPKEGDGNHVLNNFVRVGGNRNLNRIFKYDRCQPFFLGV